MYGQGACGYREKFVISNLRNSRSKLFIVLYGGKMRMKIVSLAVVLAAYIACGTQSCSKNGVGPVESANLLPNPNFELNGAPSLEYWRPCTCLLISPYTL